MPSLHNLKRHLQTNDTNFKAARTSRSVESHRAEPRQTPSFSRASREEAAFSEQSTKKGRYSPASKEKDDCAFFVGGNKKKKLAVNQEAYEKAKGIIEGGDEDLVMEDECKEERQDDNQRDLPKDNDDKKDETKSELIEPAGNTAK